MIFSTLSLSILHMISFMCAVSIVSYIMTVGIGTTAYIFSVLAILILILCKFGPHSTLNLALNLFHQTNTAPSNIVFICLLFSLVSIISSAFGTYHFSQTYGESTIIYMLIFVSLLNELLIVYCTYYIHNYQKNCYNESHLVNDLYMGNESNLFFDFLPKIKRLQTLTTDIPNTAPTLSPPTNQKPKIVVEPEPYKRTRPTEDSNNTKQARKTASKQNDKQSKQERKTGLKQPENLVKTSHVEEKQDVKVWSNAEILNQLNIYRKRIEKQGDKITKANRVGHWFFNSIKDKEQHPYITPQERAKLYKNHLHNFKNKIL